MTGLAGTRAGQSAVAAWLALLAVAAFAAGSDAVEPPAEAVADPGASAAEPAAEPGATPAVALGVEAEVERVRTLLRSDDWPAALAAARDMRERIPGDARVAAALGEALFRAGRLAEIDTLLAPLADAGEATPRGLIVMARLRAAEGRGDAAALLLAAAVERAPDDRDILYWAGDLAGSRATAIELLGRYLAMSEGDDPDRIESATGAVRVLEALGDRRVWVAVASPPSMTRPLRAIWRADGAIEGYVVEARLDAGGKPVRLLLDTGSHGLFVAERLATRRGFAPLATRTLYGGGDDRRHVAVRGIFPDFALGDLRYSDALATSTPGEFDPTGRFHGLLGPSIFGGYRVTLDLDGGTLTLERRDESLDEPVGAPRDDSLDDAPYWWVSGQLLVEVRTPAGASGLFVLDTGAGGTVLADAFARRLDAAAFGRGVPLRGFGGEVGGARQLRGVEVAYQGITIGRNGLIAMDLSMTSRIGGIEVSGLLGLDALAGRRIELDTVAQRIRIPRP